MQKAAPVEDFNDELQKLIDDMVETMYAAPGVGLAANQVGVPMQVTIIDASTDEEQVPLLVLINPEIIHTEGVIEMEEGCLSFPGYLTVVKRHALVRVKGLDREGKEIEVEGEGLMSRALQHELDHLNGVLLIDRIGRLKKEFFKKRFLKKMNDQKVGP